MMLLFGGLEVGGGPLLPRQQQSLLWQQLVCCSVAQPMTALGLLEIVLLLQPVHVA
jgi:hypothetical protein